MYDIIHRVIRAGGYKLSKVLQKIDSVWVDGDLTDQQRQQLRQLAQDGASVSGEVDILQRVLDLEQRVRILEAAQNPEEAPEEYPPFVEGKWYYAGDKCCESGKDYVCIAPADVVCVWSPSVYPAYWEEVNSNG
ncbi:MAG: hypothetical protein J6A74_03895 [Oscillospiraceae bacterium]|nr:hypothetical protein [Oscillospiraceae bacterium]